MRVDRLSRGTWIILALAIGALVAWLHTTLGDTSVHQTVAQTEFINLLMRRPAGSGGNEYPWIRSVVISPAEEFNPTYAKDSSRKAPVRYQVLTPVPAKGGWQYQPKATLVDDPIDHFGQGPQPLTVMLDGLAKDRPWIKYRYAFWQEPRWCYALWIGSSVLLVGIVWPIVLRKLVVAGYAGSLEEEKSEPFWKRLFAKKTSSEAGLGGGAVGAGAGGTKGSPTNLSEDELARINAMEAGLRDFVATQKEPGGEVDDKAEPEVKKLTAGPMETANQPVQQEQKKEYAGEFYPTATHVKKKDE